MRITDEQLASLLEVLEGSLELQHVIIAGYTCEDRRKLLNDITRQVVQRSL